MSNPERLKVSIIIPTYKQASLLAVAIESCLAQDYANKEIIITDDNSPDNTAEVAGRYAALHPEVIYRRNTVNIGRVANYRHALYNYPSGQFVLVLDGDDRLFDRGFLSRAVHHLTARGDPEAVLFYKEALTKEVNGVVLRSDQPAKENIIRIPAWQWLRDLKSLGFSHLTMIYNLEYARQSDFYKADLSSSDMASFFGMCLRFPEKQVIISNMIGGVWVKHGGNTSSNLTLKETWQSSVKLYAGVTRHTTAKKHGIGFRWATMNSVKPVLYYFLKKINLVS
jgi:glycosyltransferase involved in cell wall biosynthesis